MSNTPGYYNIAFGSDDGMIWFDLIIYKNYKNMFWIHTFITFTSVYSFTSLQHFYYDNYAFAQTIRNDFPQSSICLRLFSSGFFLSKVAGRSQNRCVCGGGGGLWKGCTCRWFQYLAFRGWGRLTIRVFRQCPVDHSDKFYDPEKKMSHETKIRLFIFK